jgi:hypothetical protein
VRRKKNERRGEETKLMGINKTNGGTEKTEKAKSVEERMGGGKAYSKEIKINEK